MLRQGIGSKPYWVVSLSVPRRDGTFSELAVVRVDANTGQGRRREGAALTSEARKSLVDVAEDALRRWLGSGRHRPGERLPPEQELSAQLGVSRGTLRIALRRLEESGEIVRRQGSGTFVGRSTSWALDEGLEKLVSYSELARRHGVRAGGGSAGGRGSGGWAASWASCSSSTPTRAATHVTRVLLLDGEPAAHMRDVVRPDISLPVRRRG